jgi:hypothetical protein
MLQQEKLISLLNRVIGQNAKFRKGFSEAVFHCPFCRENKRIPKLEICIDGSDFGAWHCWICHARGSNFISLLYKLKASATHFDELYSITKQVRYERKERDEDIRCLPREFKPLANPSDEFEFGNAWYYLAKRGVTKNDVIRYNIGYCETGEYAKRILIPSYDKNGDINFFSARDYTEQSYFKYMLSPWSKDIIGFEVLLNWNEPISIVEGAFDAIAIRKNTIPLFGTMLSNNIKSAIIENKVKRLNIILDNDALKYAVNMCDDIEKLSDKTEIHLIRLDGKDPSVLGFNQINQIINNSKPITFKDLLKIKMEL